jgi:hypothetical protein
MGDTGKLRTGGCLCGALRYEARGEPTHAGYCFCSDCRKASGSGFIPFMGFPSSAIRVSGEVRQSIAKSARGSDAVRNHCAICNSLVFGGIVGKDISHTIYAGTLDDPSGFAPTIAIFCGERPDWALMPQGIVQFEKLPG